MTISQDTGTLFVGGEFYDDECWKADLSSFPNERAIFLNGGKACLTIICDYLRDHGITRVLLPAYLCPTIVDTLESCGLSCKYYKVNADFSINTKDISHHLEEKQAVYFINYFGFSPSAFELDYLRGLQQKGKVVIEDCAQAGFLTHTIGDFAFNSMRKFCAHDGGYLKTTLDVQQYLEIYAGRENRRLPLIRQYRKGLREYLLNDQGDHEELEELFELAETYYKRDKVVLGDASEQAHIETLDWPAIKQVRRKNYEQLLGLISGNNLIPPIFPRLQPDNMPLGLPVYVNDLLRDQLNEFLGENGIGLTIHWEDLIIDPRLNYDPLAVQMASSILTLTIDQYASHEQLEYLARKLAEFASSLSRKRSRVCVL